MLLCLKCVHQIRKSYEHGENYFWNKFQPIKSDLSIPFTLPHSPVSPQAALWLFTTPELPFSSGPVSRVHLLPLQYLHVLCLTQILTVVVQSLSPSSSLWPHGLNCYLPLFTHTILRTTALLMITGSKIPRGTPQSFSPPSHRSSRITFAIFYWLLLFRCQVVSHPWTAAHLAPLSLTISQSLLKFLSIELVV